MIITSLGHTQFLVDINNSQNESVKVLIDSWISDYVLGDLMERSVKIIPDYQAISGLDAIYISHSHSDHFDPYALIKIFDKNFEKTPILLLPYTLEYLVPLIREYLGDIKIEILFPNKNFIINGITIAGHIFSQNYITNEDDVMMISIHNDREMMFAEIDTLPEEDNFEVQKNLYNILTKKKFDSVLYIASRNEMEGQIPLFDKPAEKRKNFRSEYIHERKAQMRYSYEKFAYEDFEDFPNIFTIPNFCRGFIGQGITYPSLVDEKLGLASIFPLDEIASIESDYAAQYDYNFPQKALNPGRQYRIENGNIETGRKDCPIGKLVISHTHNNEFAGARKCADFPLLKDFPLTKNESEYEKLTLDILNHRFLPYWSASSVASLRDGLLQNNGQYTILFLNNDKSPKFAFQFSFAKQFFEKISTENISTKNADETYFHRDFIDFIEGRQELYSNFWHTLEPKKKYRLWTCLGANFMNHDLIIAKYRFHFERAKS